MRIPTARILLLSALITGTAGLIGLANAAPQAGGKAVVAPKSVAVMQAKPIRDAASPMTRAEGREAADSAVAGVLMGIASEQFTGRRIELKLESLDMQAASPRDRNVQGTGMLKLDDDSDWLPFRYHALYDTETQTASWARLTLGSTDAGGQKVALQDATARSLQAESTQRMRQEFSQQQVQLQLAEVHRSNAGRYQRFTATGHARMDRQPPVRTRVEGLYDPAAKRWVRIDYEMGETAKWGFNDGTAGLASLNH